MPSKALIQELVQRMEIKREFERELAEQNPRIEALKEEIRQQFIDEGISSTTAIDDTGNKIATIYTYSSKMPSVADKEVFYEFTRKHKLGHLFTINAQTLRGFVNKELQDIDPEAAENPDKIGLATFNVVTVGVRKA